MGNPKKTKKTELNEVTEGSDERFWLVKNAVLYRTGGRGVCPHPLHANLPRGHILKGSLCTARRKYKVWGGLALICIYLFLVYKRITEASSFYYFLTKPKRAGSTAGPEPCTVPRLKQAVWTSGNQWLYSDFMCRNCGSIHVFMVKAEVFFNRLTNRKKPKKRGVYATGLT